MVEPDALFPQSPPLVRQLNQLDSPILGGGHPLNQPLFLHEGQSFGSGGTIDGKLRLNVPLGGGIFPTVVNKSQNPHIGEGTFLKGSAVI
jgi:hypothetical protein